jgi:spore photoproduct lyase
MSDIIYIEEDVIDEPLTRRICERFPRATRVPCSHYGEIFNRRGQNFRLQKQRPALILARKHGQPVMAAPPAYGLDGHHHYYFSPMLNCIYDCRYCFLQGMYRSAHQVIFVNHDDFKTAIRATVGGHDGEPCWFYSGYDCDSLAYDMVSGFVDSFIPFFRDLPQAWLELRSKSTYIRSLLRQTPIDNAVIAFSFTPEPVSAALEHGVPALAKRLAALGKLQARGWKIGLRFDPLIYCQDYRLHYRQLFRQVFAGLDCGALHSVSLGSFRLPRPFFDNMRRLYPDDAFLAGPLETRRQPDQRDIIAYRETLENELIDFCAEELLRYIPDSIFYPCYDATDNASARTGNA